jgi:hypothetical protein
VVARHDRAVGGAEKANSSDEDDDEDDDEDEEEVIGTITSVAPCAEPGPELAGGRPGQRRRWAAIAVLQRPQGADEHAAAGGSPGVFGSGGGGGGGGSGGGGGRGGSGVARRLFALPRGNTRDHAGGGGGGGEGGGRVGCALRPLSFASVSLAEAAGLPNTASAQPTASCPAAGAGGATGEAGTSHKRPLAAAAAAAAATMSDRTPAAEASAAATSRGPATSVSVTATAAAVTPSVDERTRKAAKVSALRAQADAFLAAKQAKGGSKG